MHKCCSGRRVHPQNLPVRLDRAYLRSLSQVELERELENYQAYQDTHEAGYLQVIAEDSRRYQAQTRATERKQRLRGERARATTDYRDEVYRQWLAAEGATNGYMLNAAGRRAGIDERTLFTGPQSRVNRYASDELREFFLTHPRMTRQEWDARQRRERAAERQHARGER